MGECNINFTEAENSTAYQLYQSFSGSGVTCDDLDIGYPILQGDLSNGGTVTIQGAKDDLIKAEEIQEFMLKNYERFKKTINGFVTDQQSFSISFYNRGLIAYSMQEYDPAIGYYSRAIETNPNFAPAYNNRGNVYAKIGKTDMAILDYSKAIELDPQLYDAYNNRGLVYSSIGNWPKAIEDFTRAIEIKPDFKDAYCGRAMAWHGMGSLEKEIADYSKALEIDTTIVDAYYNRGQAWHDLKDWNRAIADYTAALNINPNYASAYNMRGLAWENKGNLDEAIKDFYQAIKVDPQHQRAYLNLGRIFIITNKLDKAIESFAALIESTTYDPKNLPSIISTVLKLQWKTDDTSKAKAIAFETDTGGFDKAKVEALFICSYSYWEAGQKDNALQFLSQIDGALTFKTAPSPSSKEFFTQMFALAPATMLVDREAVQIIDSLKAKVR